MIESHTSLPLTHILYAHTIHIHLLTDSMVRTKARLEPGKMFLVDFDKGEIVTDNFIKEEIASSRDYKKVGNMYI